MSRVVIVGNESVAWLAAACLRQAFRHRGIEVAVVDVVQREDVPLGHWTLPSLRAIHGLIGIREADLVARTNATFKLASEHRRWQSETSSFLHAHGEIGAPFEGVPFYKYLLMRQLAGHSESPDRYSLAAAAARRGRFARPMGSDKSLTQSFTYALHLDEQQYCAYLREHCERLGVQHCRGTFADLGLAEDGAISTLILGDGRRIAGDYFIDCSGRNGVLTHRLPNSERDDWTKWLPVDRMLSMRAAPIPDPPALTRTLADDAGWFWRMPLADSSIDGYALASAFVSDDAAVQRLREFSGTHEGEPVAVRMAAGRLRRFWQANCIAIGDAAVELEPLAGARLHLAQLAIVTLIELFPLDERSPLEAREYNRIMGEHAEALRDFTIAHYRAGPARHGEFWTATRAEPLPSQLANKLDLYRASGRIGLLDNETFEESDWAWLLLGSGCVPDSLELHTRAILQSMRTEQIAALRMRIEQLAASMPSHAEYLRLQR